MFLWGQINVEVVLSHLFRLQYYRSHYQGGMATDKVIVNTEWSPKFVKLFENMSHRYFSTEHPFVDVLRCPLSYLKTLTISIKMHTVSVLFDPVMLKKWTVVFVCSFREGSRSQIGWIFGKIPNGLWPFPLIFGKLCCNFFYNGYGRIYAMRHRPDSIS